LEDNDRRRGGELFENPAFNIEKRNGFPYFRQTYPLRTSKHNHSPMSIVFNGSPAPTLGVELELALIDPKTGNMVNRAPDVLKELGDVDFAKPELLESIIEVITTPCATVGDIRRELRAKIAVVEKAANNLGLTTAFIGTHPSARWADMRITNNQRYRDLAERMQWAARRSIIMGLHIHVGVQSGEKAIALFNAMTTFLPHLLALSAASPFFMGEDTGLASARIKVFEGMPIAGLPQRMLNWSEFQRFLKTLIKAGAIHSIQEIWWDVRPHPRFGTIEIRICDGTPNLEDVLAIVALTQALIVYLDHLYDAGENLPIHRYWFIKENKWRALRYGLDAQVIHTDDGECRNMRDDLKLLVEEVTPTAKDLNSGAELDHVLTMADGKGSYERQRNVYLKTNSFQAVIESVIQEFHESLCS
jgi:carboxylate-amine ligase